MALVTRTLASATLLLLLLLSSLVFSFASRPVAVQTPPQVETQATCKMNTGKCFDLFQHLMNWSPGKPGTDHHCCTVVSGLSAYEAASCLCYTFRSRFFGMEMNYHAAINTVMNFCGLTIPRYFKCY
ncbi:hypothetical protein Salat_0925400 [Sesamum alatum]|uniref:Hydrophobic seed protein domain-containing protein n=1 Tax=Sesamum alatum TaxID=300844 RepID=A0AAE1YKG5_9LAMI|nr:hypothetical protein Salat_0925400 [Sesamum alatum]